MVAGWLRERSAQRSAAWRCCALYVMASIAPTTAFARLPALSGHFVPLPGMLSVTTRGTGLSGCCGQRQRQPAALVPARTPISPSQGVLRAFHRLPVVLLGTLLLMLPRTALASAGGAYTMPASPLPRTALLLRLALWVFLFTVSAVLAGAETAITTLWPWKVKQLAAADGDGSPFASLETDITKVLTTALVGVTFCTIFGTALITDVAVGVFGSAGVGYATVAITAVTLFFGEILPKSLAVARAEQFARLTLPFINGVTYLLTPLSSLTSAVSDRLLANLGVDGDEAGEAVTQPELRMVLSSASQSGAVEVYEQDMIEGVLDLQRGQVQQIMMPRVELVAISADSTLTELLEIALRTKYSRVPVYNETVDEIIGVVLTRELLRYGGAELAGTNVSTVMEAVDFIPESMSTMNALKQMRRQRAHMMIVVDEFGGTSGIVTLEDILETLVGEIYDEDDEDEVQEDTTSIVRSDDGSYVIDGMADLDMVTSTLGLEEDVPEEMLVEYSTLSGFLCHQVRGSLDRVCTWPGCSGWV